MPQVATPKGILVDQAELPRRVLGATPLAALGEGISGIMKSVASVLPDVPALPAFPAAGQALPQVPVLTEFLKSVDTILPTGLPKLSKVVPSADATPPAPVKAPALVFE